MDKNKLPPPLSALARRAKLPTIFLFTGLNKETLLLRGVKMFYENKTSLSIYYDISSLYHNLNGISCNK